MTEPTIAFWRGSVVTPMRPMMAPTEEELELARSHVAEAEKAVHRQRARLDQLRRHGHPVLDAEQLLASFEETLHVMREHLTVEESFERDNLKPTA